MEVVTTPYAKINNRVLQLLGIILLGFILYHGSSIIVPLGFSFLLSIVLLPVYRFFKRLNFPEVLAILACILFALAIIGLIVGVITYQIGQLFDDIDTLEKNIDKHLHDIGVWIRSKTGFGLRQQSTFIKQQMDSLKSSSDAIVSVTSTTLGGILVWFGLVPVYIYLILYYKNLFLRFIFLTVKSDHHDTVETSIYETETTLKSYLNGLLIEMVVVGVLVTISLYALGIKYALLIAAIFAVLNMIPYVGALVANLMAVLITLSTSTDFWDTGTVLIVLTVVQLVDNNFLMPFLVGSQMKLNALVTIVAVIVGEALAGVGGMFLSIPAVAVLKVIFDKIDGLKPWGLLFGDDIPRLNPLAFPVMRLRKRIYRLGDETTPTNTTPPEPPAPPTA